MNNYQEVTEFIFSTFKEAFEFINPNLSNYSTFSTFLSKQVQVKENENIQYNFDIEIDKIVKNQLKTHNISGKIFSEESGFFEFGERKYRVVYDPFCNSSLASKTFHEAAVGISVFSYDYNFITSAIMDYQTGIIGIVEEDKTHFYQIQNRKEIFIEIQLHENLEKSWTVVTLENREERSNFKRIEEIFNKSQRIIISSGHIYWLKLAMGMIDAYLDPIGGEQLYEMFACTVAQRNDCVVTNKDGIDFDPIENLKLFEHDSHQLFFPIASTNRKLHAEILKNIQS